jgi:hypothetical protein
MFRAVFKPETVVGIIATPPRDYDARRWWDSSAGFRAVTGEALAYAYARVVFSPPDPQPIRVSP